MSSPDAGTGACPCFNFASDGSLIDPSTGVAPVIDHLCASADFPSSDWTFTYAVFTEPGCTGTELNDGTHNFTCFDSRDLLAQANPNESIEPLEPGPNENHVLCLTTNASKTFNFATCELATTPEDMAADLTRFACGCTLADAGGCSCGPNGVGPGNLPTGCAFDAVTCDIVCPVPSVIQQGSCTESGSQSILINGTNVVSYIPKGDWNGGLTGISLINVEGTSVTPTVIPTPGIVNSCASNPVTHRTVCTSNGTDIYVLSGTTITNTLTSAGNGTLTFLTFGGSCTTCGITMDATHNRAAITVAQPPAMGAFQFLDLTTLALEPPILTHTVSHDVSEGPLIDPLRDLILNPTETGQFELINVLASPPSFFEHTSPPGVPVTGQRDAAAEDCSTGIALTPAEISPTTSPTDLWITDLSQATFTPGASQGTWSAPAQVQILSESTFTFSNGPGGIAIVQGTHIGVVSGENNGSTITAFVLPSTSGPGTGTPSIVDWVTCSVSGVGPFRMGHDPHTLAAYRSPNGGDSIALLVGNADHSEAIRVDLTQMLNPAIVPRTVGGHACAAGTLPASIETAIPVP